MLLYQTADLEFATQAVEALRAADIPCFKTGTAWSNLWYGVGLDSIAIFIRDRRDGPRASEILIRLGAAPDAPPVGPRGPVLWAAIALALLSAVWVAVHWA